MPSSPKIIFMILTNLSLKHNIKPYQNCSHGIMTKTFCCKLDQLLHRTVERLAWKLKWYFFCWLKHNFGSPAQYEFVLKLAGFVAETPCAPISIHFVWEAYFTFQLLPFQGEREKGEIRTIWESGLVSAVSLAGSSNFSRLNRPQLASSFSSAGNFLVPRTSFVFEKKYSCQLFAMSVGWIHEPSIRTILIRTSLNIET